MIRNHLILLESECIQHRSAFLRWLDANMNEVKHLVDKEVCLYSILELLNYNEILVSSYAAKLW